MIFIRNLGENVVYFPKNGVNFDLKQITLKLKSELTLKEYSFTIDADESESYLVYKVNLDFSDVEEGEYVYELNDGQWTSKGLLRVGQFKYEDKTYEKIETVKEYKYGE